MLKPVACIGVATLTLSPFCLTGIRQQAQRRSCSHFGGKGIARGVGLVIKFRRSSSGASWIWILMSTVPLVSKASAVTNG